MLDKVSMWGAWHLPKRAAMWAAVRVVAHATQGPRGIYGDTVVPNLTAMEALRRWDNAKYAAEYEVLLCGQ